MHDFIICYAKNKINDEVKFGWQRNLLERRNEMNKRYSNPDNDLRGNWKSVDFSVKTYSKEYDYAIELPSGRIVNPPQGRCWTTSKNNFKKLIEENRIWFGTKGDSAPSMKKFLTDVQQGIVPVTIWGYSEVGHNQQAKQDLKEIFHEVSLPFDTPKPISLIKKIIKIASNENDIILDSFAGSGTTAHAVLDLNKEDGGNRKFIMVEMEEYADSITAERVRRVIKGVRESKNFKEGTGGTFSYFELGEPIEMESILKGENLPNYEEFAKYLFYTATGEDFDLSKINEETNYIGTSKDYEVYLFYKPDLNYLKSTAFTLDRAKSLGQQIGKPATQNLSGSRKRLVFAPAKFVDNHTLTELRIEFCQLPFEIYKLKG